MNKEINPLILDDWANGSLDDTTTMKLIEFERQMDEYNGLGKICITDLFRGQVITLEELVEILRTRFESVDELAENLSNRFLTKYPLNNALPSHNYLRHLPLSFDRDDGEYRFDQEVDQVSIYLMLTGELLCTVWLPASAANPAAYQALAQVAGVLYAKGQVSAKREMREKIERAVGISFKESEE